MKKYCILSTVEINRGGEDLKSVKDSDIFTISNNDYFRNNFELLKLPNM